MDPTSSQAELPEGAAPAQDLTPDVAPEVPMGQSMPELRALPTLQPMLQALPAVSGDGPRHSTLADGLSFTGSAQISGSLTVAGEVQGNVVVSAQDEGHVTITETGTVVGDITARNISVLGQTEGLLDAAGGRVSLHSTASVSGRIRYTHLQVNGADLNAQLERVRSDAGNTHGH